MVYKTWPNRDELLRRSPKASWARAAQRPLEASSCCLIDSRVLFAVATGEVSVAGLLSASSSAISYGRVLPGRMFRENAKAHGLYEKARVSRTCGLLVVCRDTASDAGLLLLSAASQLVAVWNSQCHATKPGRGGCQAIFNTAALNVLPKSGCPHLQLWSPLI